MRKSHYLDDSAHIHLPRLQKARPDHVRVKSSSCCFPRKLASFDKQHVTRPPLIGKQHSLT